MNSLKPKGPWRHGHTRRDAISGKVSVSPTYRTWMGMMNRCLGTTSKDYKAYGARGITVCERWHRFENFLSDMGERPTGTSIDRIDNSKGYEPSNCRWATPFQQNLNRRCTILNPDLVAQIRSIYAAGGVTQRVLADRFGISQTHVKDIVKRRRWRAL